MGKHRVHESKKRRSMRAILYTIVIAFAVVSFWRGVWGLMDLYLIPKNPTASFIVSALIGLVILYATKHLVDELM